MAIEKVMTPSLPGDFEDPVKIATDDENINVDESGNVEVTLPDNQALMEAEAMGMLDEEMQQDPMTDFDANLVEFMEESDIVDTALELYEGYTVDKESREEYDSIAEDGVNLLGLQYEESSEPFPGACGVTHPVLAQEVVKVQA